MYKENVRIGEALQIHMQEEKKLKKLREKLEEQNQVLSDEKEMNDMVIKEKVSETKQQKRLIKEVRDNLLISMAYWLIIAVARNMNAQTQIYYSRIILRDFSCAKRLRRWRRR